jgi:hypothetical protein
LGLETLGSIREFEQEVERPGRRLRLSKRHEAHIPMLFAVVTVPTVKVVLGLDSRFLLETGKIFDAEPEPRRILVIHADYEAKGQIERRTSTI